jgi:carboxypeptidase C (cathepsin A)
MSGPSGGPGAFALRTSSKIRAGPSGPTVVFSSPDTKIAPAQSVPIIDAWYKAIAGESYGGQRVAALSRILAEQYSDNLNRAVLISPALNVDLADRHYDLVGPMTLLPTQASIAAFHDLSTMGKGPDAIEAVEDFAMDGYVSGLARLGR